MAMRGHSKMRRWPNLAHGPGFADRCCRHSVVYSILYYRLVTDIVTGILSPLLYPELVCNEVNVLRYIT